MGWGVGLAAGASIAGGISGSRSAKKAAAKAGRYNKRQIVAETKETLRRARLANEQMLGGARARLGSSGVVMRSGTWTKEDRTDTGGNYLTDMAKEQQLQMDWTQKSGDMRARAALKTGQMQADNIGYQGWTNAFSQTVNWYQQGAFSSTANPAAATTSINRLT